ncbi:ferredoxin [Actinomadura madurae]|uniref:ferredoxin n=1 Tax=Actinomadura madurae TaxID=1993 RepID=UPI002026CBB4|nr:ferredoxin [Actinomadura madurae]URN09870.1 ferredoxin [Actinomadura madurae]
MTMQISVDRDVCEIHAQCVFTAPDVFELDEDGELVYDPAPDAQHVDAVRRAALACPVQAISARIARTPSPPPGRSSV